MSYAGSGVWRQAKPRKARTRLGTAAAATPSIGEVIAAGVFGLDLLDLSKPAHEALDATIRRLQIKTTGGKMLAPRAGCDHLLVLQLWRQSMADVTSAGSGAPVWATSGPLGTNGQRSIRLAKVRMLGAVL
jgi:hypothetical protein